MSYVNDTESPGELARLINQANLLQRCTGVLPRYLHERKFQRVLDIGCGPGSWVLDIAAANPDAEVIGIDSSKLMVEYASSRARVLAYVDNAEFEVRNALDPEFPVKQEKYDYINLSLANSWVPTTAAWNVLLQKCFTALDPGGVVVVTESEAVITNSVALHAFQSFLLNAFKASGRGASVGEHFGVVEHLGNTLRAVGFQKITTEINALNFSYYNEYEHRTQLDMMPVLFSETKLFLLSQKVTTWEELADISYECLVQMAQEEFTAITPLYTFIGEKEGKNDGE